MKGANDVVGTQRSVQQDGDSGSIHNENKQPGVFTIGTSIGNDSSQSLDDRTEHRKIAGKQLYPSEARTSSQKCVVLASACFNVLVAMGFPFSVGALYVEIISTYSASRREAALVQGFCIGILFGAGLITGFIVDRFGVRISLMLGGFLGFLGLFISWFATSLIFLIATLGVVTGFGSSLIYMSSSVFVASAFGKARRLALPGLAVAAGVGTVLLPKLLEFLLAEYGLKGTLLVTSGLYLNCVPSGVIVTSQLGIVHKKSNKKETIDSKTNYVNLKKKLGFLKDPFLVIYLLSAGVALGTMNSTVVAMLDLIESRGYASDVGVQLLLIYNSVNTVTRLGSGLLTMMPRVSGAMVFSFSFILCAISLLLLRSASDFSVILALIVLFGVGYGGLVGIHPFTILELAGSNVFPLALGVSGLVNGICNPTGATVMGWMYDQTNSYELPLLIYGTVGNCVAGILFIAILTDRLKASSKSKVYVMNC